MIQMYWSCSPEAIPVSSPHVERAQIDMWTAHYKSTSLKLNCARSTVVHIPRWRTLILIINLLSLAQKGLYSRHKGGLKLWESTARERMRRSFNEFSFYATQVKTNSTHSAGWKILDRENTFGWHESSVGLSHGWRPPQIFTLSVSFCLLAWWVLTQTCLAKSTHGSRR